MLSSPFISKPVSVSNIMLTVILALVPGIAFYVWSYGPAVLVSISLACITALGTEAIMLKLRNRPLKPFLTDYSALLTGFLLGVSVPALAPWWMVVVGTAFAIAVAKHLYGGLGSNPFNPAMVGYAALIISFPVQMTHWVTPHGVDGHALSFADQLGFIFGNHLPNGLTLDAVTTATPLDTLKTQLHMHRPMADILAMPIYGEIAGKGSELVALGFLIGGIWLLVKRIITWHIPVGFFGALAVTAGLYHLYDPAHYISPVFHLVAGASMLGAFFILTDPVTGPTTPKGKLIFAGGAGVLTYMIRVFGGFPDGIAFATLLMNICAPLIDVWSQPKVFGAKGAAK